MTDHTHISDRHDGDYDPMIADRFRVLDRVTPPNVGGRTVVMAAPGGANGSDPSGRRSGFLVAVAASVAVLVVGFVAVVAATGGVGGGGRLTEEAGDAGDVPVVADGASDTTVALLVEGDSVVGSTTRSEAGGEESDSVEGDSGDGGTDNDRSSSDGSTASGSAGSGDGASKSGASGSGTSTPPNGSTESDSGSGGDGPAPTVADGPAIVMPAADGDRPIVTFSTATTDKLPTTGGGSGDAAAGIVSLSGTVTEVFTDCVSRLLLTETGQVVQGGPVSCDGGSYIVVNGTRVFTASGFTSADLAFDKHPSNLKPGQEVSVTASRIGTSGPLTLACDTCRVRIV